MLRALCWPLDAGQRRRADSAVAQKEAVAGRAGRGDDDGGTGAGGAAAPDAAAPPVPVAVASQPPTLRLIKLHVESEPPGVEVVQVDNGEVLGKTPWSMSLPGASGQLRLRLRLPGYAEQSSRCREKKQRHAGAYETPNRTDRCRRDRRRLVVCLRAATCLVRVPRP